MRPRFEPKLEPKDKGLWRVNPMIGSKEVSLHIPKSLPRLWGRWTLTKGAWSCTEGRAYQSLMLRDQDDDTNSLGSGTQTHIRSTLTEAEATDLKVSGRRLSSKEMNSIGHKFAWELHIIQSKSYQVCSIKAEIDERSELDGKWLNQFDSIWSTYLEDWSSRRQSQPSVDLTSTDPVDDSNANCTMLPT